MIVRSPLLLLISLLLAAPSCITGFPMFILGTIKTRCLSVTAPQDTVLKVAYDAPGKKIHAVVVSSCCVLSVLSAVSRIIKFLPSVIFVRWSKPNFLEQETYWSRGLPVRVGYQDLVFGRPRNACHEFCASLSVPLVCQYIYSYYSFSLGPLLTQTSIVTSWCWIPFFCWLY